MNGQEPRENKIACWGIEPIIHCRLYIYIDLYVLQSSDAGRPPSRQLAHTGARYEISDLREIYGAGTRNSACSSGGCSSGGGPQSEPFWRHMGRALAPRRFSGNPRRSLFGGWALQNGTYSGGGIGRKIQAGRSTIHCFGSAGPESVTPVSLHLRKIIGSSGIEQQ